MALGPASSQPVVVTGASSGIGREIARILVSHRYPVCLVARREEKLAEIADEFRRQHDATVDVIPCDLSDASARAELCSSLTARGPIAGLCNCAGFGTSGRFHELPIDRESDEIILNVVALAELTRAVLPGMVAASRGAVLNAGSIAGFQPIPGMATYAATKAFVLSFSRAVNEELRNTGVHCTALCPGPVPTEWADIAGVTDVPEILETTPQAVADAAVKAMIDGTDVVVPGLGPRIVATMSKLVPDKLIIRATARNLSDD